MRSALLLTLGAFSVTMFVRALCRMAMPQALRTLLACAGTLCAFGGGAYLGLCRINGDCRSMIPRRALSRAQVLWTAVLGALAVCPMSLAADLLLAPFGGQGAAAMIAPSALLVVKSALIVPVCEELFFRGYLLGALLPAGRARAVTAVSLCFAAMHPSNFAAHALLGALLGAVTLRTQSLLAPVLVHGAYNLTLLVLGGVGLGGLLTQLSLVSCIVRLLGCAACAYACKQVWTARTSGAALKLWEGSKA